MALIGINPSHPEQRGPSRLEQIAMGFDIASKALGTALAIPEFLAKKKQAESESELTRMVKGTQITESQRRSTVVPEDVRKQVAQAMGPSFPMEMIPKTQGELEDFSKARAGAITVQPITPYQKEELGLKKQALEQQKIDRERQRQEASSGKFLAGGFGARMLESEKNFDELKKVGFDRADPLTASQANPLVPNIAKSPEFQRQEQAERNFVNATLRRESGAAIAKTEYESAEKQYFPRSGDSPGVLKQKRENRLQAIRSMLSEAGPEVRGQILKKDMQKMYDQLIHGDENPNKISKEEANNF